MLKTIIDGVLPHQRPDGYFGNYIDQPETYSETTAGAMIAFAIYESARGGWLPAPYIQAADKMRAATRAKVDSLGFVQGACGAPRFDEAGISAEGQGFFLLMEVAAKKWELAQATCGLPAVTATP